MTANDGQLVIEDAQILFRNFAGAEGMYNAEGDRNFCVLLDDALADEMRKDGWNVKELKAREEGDTPQAYLQISVKYRGRNGNLVRPPTLVMVTSRGRTSLSEEECEILDWVDIAHVDLIVRPFRWEVNGKSGVKAYLRSIYVTIEEDYLQLKYADVPALDGDDPDVVLEAEVVEEQKALEEK